MLGIRPFLWLRKSCFHKEISPICLAYSLHRSSFPDSMDMIRIRSWKSVVAACFLGLSWTAAGCSRETASASAAPGAGRGSGGGAAVPVTITKVVSKPMPLNITVIGTVEASSTVAVRSQITGQLTSVNFKEGDDVTQGQVLFALDRRPLEGTLAQ